MKPARPTTKVSDEVVNDDPELRRHEPTTGIAIAVTKTFFHPVQITWEEGMNRTFGQIIDEMIGEAIDRGDKVSGFEIVITDEDWHKLSKR